MTFWIIATLVVVALLGLAWWVSGRSRPLARMDGEAARLYADTVAHHEMTGIREPPSRAGF